VPDSVKAGVKKQGPTVKELEEEFGGAGLFYIPIEEHYLLEKEEWRYDKWPDFYLGKNVMDYYDADIEERLKKIEEEEDKLLAMEGAENDVMEGEDDEDGISDAQLKMALKDVNGKKSILKMKHKLKST
jgi:nucleolar GTP-binding protein